jgi:hypothetical protein
MPVLLLLVALPHKIRVTKPSLHDNKPKGN